MKVHDVLAPCPADQPPAEGSAGAPDRKPRRPYAPPAIETAGGFAPIALGTKPPIGPGRGC